MVHGTHRQNYNVSKFSFFPKKRQKMTQNYQFQSITLYISKIVDHIIKIFDIQGQDDISRCFSLLFKKYIQHCNYKNSYQPTSTVYLINTCFPSSSINAKKKYRGVPHLLHIVIFLTYGDLSAPFLNVVSLCCNKCSYSCHCTFENVTV